MTLEGPNWVSTPATYSCCADVLFVVYLAGQFERTLRVVLGAQRLAIFVHCAFALVVDVENLAPG